MNRLLHEGRHEFPLRQVEYFNWFLACLLPLLVYAVFSFFIAKSVFVGCLLANISFLFLKRDMVSFLQGKLILNGHTNSAKTLFYIKYYARLTMVALVLYFLISKNVVHPFGLLVGLSVVVLSIGLTVTSVIVKKKFVATEA